ncbi:MAG TPA: glycosyltransferase family 39 protein [Burkholderiales bacterium]|nr:glycosyltransferase family 39 protein [Burkholderiales bacterium]
MSPAARLLPSLTPRQWLLAALALTLAFRFWLAAAAPITADEAYFVLWGRHPALGYYDHPPMVGWLLAPLVALSHAVWVARLPATLAPAITALLVRAALGRWFGRDAATADLAALAVLLAPMSVWNVLITTDTPLLVFSVASLLVFARAVQLRSGAHFLAAGMLLGLAFLSKYFAVLLGLGYLAWAVSARDARAFGLVFLGALPAGLLNLYWNYEACWCNVMFNAINRHEGAAFSWATPPLYLATVAYAAGPLAWFAWRERSRLGRGDPVRRAILLAWLVPAAVFALLSPVRTIGLHWLQSFVPALALSVAVALERRALAVSAGVLAAIALLHAVAIGVAAALPAEAWKATALYRRIVFPGRTAELLAAAAPLARGRVLAADSYAAAALFAFAERRPVPVFGAGDSHARQSDLDTDWRALDGKDFLILRRGTPLPRDYRPYFRKVEFRTLALSAGTYHAVLGDGFDYAAYRAGILAEARERFYRIPAWLPIGRCYFFDRYFPR